MSRFEKMLTKMRNNPRGWRIEELKSLADRLGIDWDHDGTRHAVFRHPGAEHVSVPADRPIKPIYILQFLDLVDAVLSMKKEEQ